MSSYLPAKLAKLLLLLGILLLSAGSYARSEGIVRIITRPGDARLYINGERKGSSGANEVHNFAIKLPQGQHRIEAVVTSERQGRKYGSKTFFVGDDSLQTLILELQDFEGLTPTLQERVFTLSRTELRSKYASSASPILPAMMLIKAGCFSMGGANDPEHEENELPQHQVCFGEDFMMGKYEITFTQWDACVADGVCRYQPGDVGWGRDARPVINISWNHAKEFLLWINAVTEGGYRLPSEAEWEYAARAGTRTAFATGDSINISQANFDDRYPGRVDRGWHNQTLEVGKFPPNAWGLHDMHGNVSEWLQDCWHRNYLGAPTDGAAWLHLDGGICDRAVARGGSWFSKSDGLRSAKRHHYARAGRFYIVGLRLLQNINQP